MMVHKSYVDALCNRLDLLRFTPAWQHKAEVRAIVCEVLEEIQHRIYQDVASNLLDLAKDINPKTERK